MKINNLASSSKGNCTHIYTDKASILIDAGISMKKVFEGLDDEFKNGKLPENYFDAVFITHEHGDHIGGAGPLGRKTHVPIHVHEDSYARFESKLGKCNIVFIDPAATYTVGDLEVSPFSTPHDAAYSMGYIIKDTTTGKKLGYLTDCGSFTRIMTLALTGCDGYLIEADYDEQKLAAHDEYDDLLKDRISSGVGHLSTQQTIAFLQDIKADSAEFIVFCHLSHATNSPEAVLQVAQTAFPDYNNFSVAPNEQLLEL
jgi:phosphoribosyl 1,2-cyclic phosphodiesterase